MSSADDERLALEALQEALRSRSPGVTVSGAVVEWLRDADLPSAVLARALNRLFVGLLKLGRFAAVLELVDRLAEASFDSQEPGPTIRRQLPVRRVNALLGLGRYDEAGPLITATLADLASDEQARQALLSMLEAAANWRELGGATRQAETTADLVVALRSENPPSAVAVAAVVCHLLVTLGAYADALLGYELALDRLRAAMSEVDLCRALAGQAAASLRVGRYEACRTECEALEDRLGRTDREEARELVPLVSGVHACALIRLGRTAEAVEVVRRCSTSIRGRDAYAAMSEVLAELRVGEHWVGALRVVEAMQEMVRPGVTTAELGRPGLLQLAEAELLEILGKAHEARQLRAGVIESDSEQVLAALRDELGAAELEPEPESTRKRTQLLAAQAEIPALLGSPAPHEIPGPVEP